ARVLEQALRNIRIPYTVAGGQSFFDRAEIRDVLAYLRLIANDADDPAFLRAVTTPRRGIGQTTLKALGEFAQQQGVSLFEAVFQASSQELLSARAQSSLDRFVAWVQAYQERASGKSTLPAASASGILPGMQPASGPVAVDQQVPD